MNPIKYIPLRPSCTEIWASGAEQHAVHLTYDVGDYLKIWPDAVPSVAFERADGHKYAHAFELREHTLHIPLLLADTLVPGVCKCMITLTNGDGQANTAVFFGSMTEGIDTLNDAPDEPEMGIIEQVNAAAARAEAAAGLSGPARGGSGILLAQITSDDGETFASDKTYDEILAALAGGQMVYAVLMNTYYIPLIGAADGVILFSLVAAIFGSVSMISMTISSDNTVMVESMQ